MKLVLGLSISWVPLDTIPECAGNLTSPKDDNEIPKDDNEILNKGHVAELSSRVEDNED